MAKYRAVNTKFWDDSYIISLDPLEKLLFLYFITNPLTNICGIYEISLKRISFDTKIPDEIIEKIFKKFEADKKMVYRDGWIYIKNFIKNQLYNPKVKKGIERNLKQIPKHILDTLSIDYDSLYIAYDTLSIDYDSLSIDYGELKPKLKPKHELELKLKQEPELKLKPENNNINIPLEKPIEEIKQEINNSPSNGELTDNPDICSYYNLIANTIDEKEQCVPLEVLRTKFKEMVENTNNKLKPLS